MLSMEQHLVATRQTVPPHLHSVLSFEKRESTDRLRDTSIVSATIRYYSATKISFKSHRQHTDGLLLWQSVRHFLLIWEGHWWCIRAAKGQLPWCQIDNVFGIQPVKIWIWSFLCRKLLLVCRLWILIPLWNLKMEWKPVWLNRFINKLIIKATEASKGRTSVRLKQK